MTRSIEEVRAAHKNFSGACRLWKEHGGGQHGPHTETLTMPLANFGKFVEALLSSVKGPAELMLRQELANLRKRISDTHKTPVKHTNCDEPHCPICEGGLFVCADCGAAEIETEQRVCTGPVPTTTTLEWEDCPCGVCGRSYPTNIGHFTDGSGFDPEERVLLDRAFATLATFTAGEREPVEHQWRVGRSDRHQPDDWKWSQWQPGRKPQKADTQYSRYEERALYTFPPASELEALRKERDEAVIRGWRAAIDCVTYAAANSYGPRVDSAAVTAARDALVDELLSGSPGDYLDVEWRGAQDAILATARTETAEARLAESLKALDDARAAILEADPSVLTCTLWMPERISPNETVADYLDAAARRVRDGGQAE